jgi:hypothetical protein
MGPFDRDAAVIRSRDYVVLCADPLSSATRYARDHAQPGGLAPFYTTPYLKPLGIILGLVWEGYPFTLLVLTAA